MQGGWQPPPGGGGYGQPPGGPGQPGQPGQPNLGNAPTMLGDQQSPVANAPYPAPPTHQAPYQQPAPYGAPPNQTPPPQSPGFAPPPYGSPAGTLPSGFGQPQQPMQPAPYGGPMPQVSYGGYGNYEFNDQENAVIAKAAGRARMWGIISIVIGALYTLSGFFFFLSPGLLTNFASGIKDIIVGVVFLGVAGSLTSVVQTQGNDVQHMMQALDKLSTSLMVQIIVTIVGVVLGAILMVIGMLVLVAAAAAGP